MTSSTSTTTNQLQYMTLGGPLELHEASIPPLGLDEVLIRQQVIALNPLDIKQRQFGFMIPAYPYVLGVEGAGTVEAVGSDVTHLSPGDEVFAGEFGGPNGKMFSAGAYGAFQSLVVVPTSLVAKKPNNISLEEAASLPGAFVTAVSAVVGALNIPLPFLKSLSAEGDVPASILVLGGSSAVGASAIQLLRNAYSSLTIVATASKRNHERVKILGANHVVDYSSSTVVADLKAASPNAAGFDAIIDAVSAGASQPDICDVLDPHGSKRYAAVETGIPVAVPAGVHKLEPGIGLANEFSVFNRPEGKSLIPSLTKLVEDGNYKVSLPVRVVGRGLEEIPSAMKQVMSASGEKLIVVL